MRVCPCACIDHETIQIHFTLLLFYFFFLSYSMLYIYCFFNKGGMPTILLRIPAVKTDTFRLWTVLQVNASEYGKTQRKSTTYGLKSYFQAPSG